MSKFGILLFLIVAAAAFDPKPSRLFSERIRSQVSDEKTSTASEDLDSHDNGEYTVTGNNDKVMGSMDTLASLARVQRDQAETFRLWSSQFRVFKNNVLKFMEQTSGILQKNDKKIKTLQRVVQKISKDIDED